MVLVIVGQLLFNREYFWLPQWLLKRSVARAHFEKALRFLSKPARFIYKFIRPRMMPLTRSAANRIIAILCILIAVIMPLMEVVPFAGHSAGAVLTAYALSIIAQDGVLALIGMILSCAIAALVIRTIVL